jgi:AmmeMemoRadiSam system protein A
MEPTHSPDSAAEGLNPYRRRALLRVARSAIEYGFAHDGPPAISADDHDEVLLATRATFVTLHHLAALRGCIGTLEARRPLVLDVACNAYAAAFRDPRFAPVRGDEFAELEIHIAVLSRPTPLAAHSEEDLIRRLKPGMDGVVIAEGRHRATFLPAVWETLREPREFIAQLKVKAGLPAEYWSATLKVSRYTVESVP